MTAQETEEGDQKGGQHKTGRGRKMAQFENMEYSDTYEPFEHRGRTHATSNMETLLHLIKGSVGAGMLAMPLAFKNAGLLTATIGTILISFLASYCMHQLLRVQYHICKRQKVPKIEYADAMQIAVRNGPDCLKWLTKPAPYLVDFFVCAYQLGICCAYIGFIAGTAKQVADFHWALNWDIRIWMIITGVVISPLNQIRNLHYLSPLSAAGDFLLIGGMGIIYYFIFKDGVPSLEGTRMIAEQPFTGFALFFGTLMYAVQTIGVIVALEDNMKTPADYRKPGGVFNTGMVVITIGYLMTGFWGYIKYQDSTEPTITWNLPTADPFTECTKIMFAILITLTYPLQCFVPIEILWNKYCLPHMAKTSDESSKVVIYSTVLRAVILWGTVILAVTIPFLDLLISIVGGFTLPCVGITFPALMEICVYHNELRLTKALLAKNLALVAFGLFSCVLSTYVCLLTIYEKE